MGTEHRAQLATGKQPGSLAASGGSPKTVRIEVLGCTGNDDDSQRQFLTGLPNFSAVANMRRTVSMSLV